MSQPNEPDACSAVSGPFDPEEATSRAGVGRPCITLGRLLLVVALIGFHLAVIGSHSPPFGLGNLEVGLLPGVTALAVALLWAGVRPCEGGGAFVRGFAASLAVAMGVYLICCLMTPDLVRSPVVYYINEIEPSLYDADLAVTYRFSLEIQGLILGLPQLLFALAGGAASRAVAKTSRPAPAGG